MKIYLLLFLLVYLIFTFIYPSFRVYKHTGINPITFKNTDSVHDFIGIVMKLLIGCLFITTLFFAIGAEAYKYLVPIVYLVYKPLFWIGFCLIHISLIWIIIAQYHMSVSWRIGIDKIHESKLVTDGIFSISRNPVFFGMIITTIGLFLLMPNAINLSILFLTIVIINIQIRLEEEFLLDSHGNSYQNYKSKTRRFL